MQRTFTDQHGRTLVQEGQWVFAASPAYAHTLSTPKTDKYGWDTVFVPAYGPIERDGKTVWLARPTYRYFRPENDSVQVLDGIHNCFCTECGQTHERSLHPSEANNIAFVANTNQVIFICQCTTCEERH